jgi:hypothetical protein
MAKEILGYFLRNPLAADSLEGIAAWRLLDETIHRRVEDTRHALDWLVSEGYLRERVSRGTAPLYSLNHGKRTDAAAIVKQRRPLAPPPNGGGSR